MILLRGRLGRAGVALVAAVGLIVGWALVYAGFHWFSDVLGAYPFAIVIVLDGYARLPPEGIPDQSDRTGDSGDRGTRQPVTTRSQAGA